MIINIRNVSTVQGPEVPVICSTGNVSSTPVASLETGSYPEEHLNVVYEEVGDIIRNSSELIEKANYLVTACPAYGCSIRGDKGIQRKNDKLS